MGNVEAWRVAIESSWVPLFPLPACVLYPGIRVPLHVFEPRYRAMMVDILDRPEQERCIALALLKDAESTLYHTKRAPVYPIVCTGRLTAHEVLPDGRYNILVQGMTRGTVLDEDRARSYRRVRLAAWRPIRDRECVLPAPELADIVHRLEEAAQCGALSTSTVCRLTDDSGPHEAWIDRLAFHLIKDGDCVVKQRILDEPALRTRADILLRWLRAVVLEARRRHDASEPQWPPPIYLN